MTQALQCNSQSRQPITSMMRSSIRQVVVHKCDSHRAFVNQVLSPLRWREASC